MPEPRKATRWTDEQREALSEVSAADLEEAKAWARRHTKPGDGGLDDPAELLNAKPDDTPTGTP